MEFKTITKNALFFDPFNNFELTERATEIRTDPLLGNTTRLIYFPVSLPPVPDQTAISDATKPFCPFCRPGVFEKTPRFPEDLVPEGRIENGTSIVFPNAFPYDEYSAVGVVGEEHFVPMDCFQPEVLRDAFIAAEDYIKRVYKKDASYRYHSINMNYMPLAGGSIIHPHIQIIAGDVPTNYQRIFMEKSREYEEKNGSRFFQDLVREEEKVGQRFIYRGDETVWLSAFAPMGICEFIAISDDDSPIVEMGDGAFHTLARDITSVLKYLAEINFMSFNMSIYSALPEDSPFATHVRIVPRTQLPPIGASDINYFNMLHNEVLTIIRPEDAAYGVKKYFFS